MRDLYTMVSTALGLLLLALAANAEDGPIAQAGSPGPSPEAVIGMLPFDPSAPVYRVQVDLAKEGARSLSLVLDTGANVSVVTPRYARSIGVSVRRDKDTPYRRATSLGRDLQFWVDTRSSDTGSQTGWEYGVLGGSFLEEYVLEIDYPNRVVRFLDPDEYEVPKATSVPDERVIPLRLSGKRPFADLEINGTSRQVLLDTGAPDNVVLSGSNAKKFGVDWKQLPDLATYEGVKGAIPVRLFEPESVRFAGFDVGAVPVIVAPRGLHNQGGNTDSVIGYDILKQFVLRFDYPRRRLWLKQTGDTTPTYLGIDYALVRESGAFMLQHRGGIQLIGVRPGSPAAALGLRQNDIVVGELGGEDVDAEAFVRDLIAGKPITVARVVDDVTIDITLPVEKWTDEDDERE